MRENDEYGSQVDKEETLNFTLLPEKKIDLMISELNTISPLSQPSRAFQFFYKDSQIVQKIDKDKDIVPRAMIYNVDKTYCFIISSYHQVFGFGDNSLGQLGLGHKIDRDLPTLIQTLATQECIQIAAGRDHTLFLTREGRVYSCGENRFGQLGQNITSMNKKGNYPKLKVPILIKSLENKKISKVACGAYFSLFMTDQGEVFLCGAGRGNVADLFAPTRINPDNVKIVDIVCGENHIILLTAQGDVYSCGNNYSGAAGQHNASNLCEPKRISLLRDKKIVQAYCGNDFTVLRTDQDETYICGRNYHGQLGLGHNKDQMFPVLLDSFSGEKIKQVFCGDGCLFFKTDKNKIYASGWNCMGQLGLGDMTDRNVPTLIKSFMDEEIINISCGKAYTLFWSNKFMYVSGRNQFSAFKFLNCSQKYLLNPEPIRNLIFYENQSVGEEFSASRPWSID